MNNLCQIQWFGQIEYGQTLELQKELVAKRAANEIPDTLLLLEHPQTYTVGVDGHRQQLLISGQEMARLNIAYHKVDRGGAIFYHCPGQLVVCPILKLDKNCLNYHDYIKKLESVIIHALSLFKVRAFRQPGQGGIWVFSSNLVQPDRPGYLDDAMTKISAIGVKVDRHGITSHGFWINVNPNLQFFDLIVPAGVKDCQVTSLQHILDRPVGISAVIDPLVQSFCRIFELEPLSLETPVTRPEEFNWNTSPVKAVSEKN